jgi:hypothetical protein
MRIDHGGPLIRVPEQIIDCSASSFEVVTNCDLLLNLPFPGSKLRASDLKMHNLLILMESYDNLMRIENFRLGLD